MLSRLLLGARNALLASKSLELALLESLLQSQALVFEAALDDGQGFALAFLELFEVLLVLSLASKLDDNSTVFVSRRWVIKEDNVDNWGVLLILEIWFDPGVALLRLCVIVLNKVNSLIKLVEIAPFPLIRSQVDKSILQRRFPEVCYGFLVVVEVSTV